MPDETQECAKDMALEFTLKFPEDAHKLRIISVLGEHPEGVTARRVSEITGDSCKVVYDFLSELSREGFVVVNKKTYADKEDGTLTIVSTYELASPLVVTLAIFTPESPKSFGD